MLCTYVLSLFVAFSLAQNPPPPGIDSTTKYAATYGTGVAATALIGTGAYLLFSNPDKYEDGSPSNQRFTIGESKSRLKMEREYLRQLIATAEGLGITKQAVKVSYEIVLNPTATLEEGFRIMETGTPRPIGPLTEDIVERFVHYALKENASKLIIRDLVTNEIQIFQWQHSPHQEEAAPQESFSAREDALRKFLNTRVGSTHPLVATVQLLDVESEELISRLGIRDVSTLKARVERSAYTESYVNRQFRHRRVIGMTTLSLGFGLMLPVIIFRHDLANAARDGYVWVREKLGP